MDRSQQAAQAGCLCHNRQPIQEVRKAGVLIGLENRDDLDRSWEFDPLCLRHFLNVP